MPFTPTHVLAVAPLLGLRRQLPFAAAAIGAMIPDFPLFFQGLVPYSATHSFAGLLTVCAPLGFALWLVWERVMAAPLVALAPDWVIKRVNVAPRPSFHPVAALAAVACISFGALTHIVWDAFTHYGQWGVALVPFLDQTTSVGGTAVRNFKLLQYGGSILGLPLLLAIFWRALAVTPPAPVVGALPSAARAAVAFGLLGGAVVVGVVRALASGAGVYIGVFYFVTAGGAALALLALAWAGVFHLTWRSAATPT